jgi:hypothetical protein
MITEKIHIVFIIDPNNREWDGRLARRNNRSERSKICFKDENLSQERCNLLLEFGG